MIRKNGDISRKEKMIEKNIDTKVISTTNKDIDIYYSFILLYQKRWSIEECFKELKSYLCFEKFKVQSYEPIHKYLHIILLAHSILYIIL